MPKLPEDPNVSKQAIVLSQELMAIEESIITKRQKELDAYKEIKSRLATLRKAFIEQSPLQPNVNNSLQEALITAEAMIDSTYDFLKLLLEYPQYIIDLHTKDKEVTGVSLISINYENLLRCILDFFTKYQKTPELTLGSVANTDISEQFNTLLEFLTSTSQKLTPLKKSISKITNISSNLLTLAGKRVLGDAPHLRVNYQEPTSLQKVTPFSRIVAMLYAVKDANQTLAQIDVRSVKKSAATETNAAQQQQIIQAKTPSNEQPTIIQYQHMLEEANKTIATLQNEAHRKDKREKRLTNQALDLQQQVEALQTTLLGKKELIKELEKTSSILAEEIKKQPEYQKSLAQKDLTIASLEAKLTAFERQLEETNKKLQDQQKQAADPSQQQTKAPQSKASPTIFKTATPAVPAAMAEKPKSP